MKTSGAVLSHRNMSNHTVQVDSISWTPRLSTEDEGNEYSRGWWDNTRISLTFFANAPGPHTRTFQRNEPESGFGGAGRYFPLVQTCHIAKQLVQMFPRMGKTTLVFKRGQILAWSSSTHGFGRNRCWCRHQSVLRVSVSFGEPNAECWRMEIRVGLLQRI